ncbi:hypothetical protein BS17DRAFT_815438 [Gyrodon lividus]|nr:hypothetical protein BS17DRAFT_815438 [Gyrodon lividus]
MQLRPENLAYTAEKDGELGCNPRYPKPRTVYSSWQNLPVAWLGTKSRLPKNRGQAKILEEVPLAMCQSGTLKEAVSSSKKTQTQTKGLTSFLDVLKLVVTLLATIPLLVLNNKKFIQHPKYRANARAHWRYVFSAPSVKPRNPNKMKASDTVVQRLNSTLAASLPFDFYSCAMTGMMRLLVEWMAVYPGQCKTGLSVADKTMEMMPSREQRASYHQVLDMAE